MQYIAKKSRGLFHDFMSRFFSIKQNAFIFILPLVGMVSAFLLLEIGVRIFHVEPRPLEPLPIAMYQLSDNTAIRFEYRPGYQPSTDDPEGFSLHNRFPINGVGFRGPEYDKVKPEKTYRIIVLGDSTTAGIGVQDMDNIFSQQLEVLLNNNVDAEKNYEVMNMGVGGYQTMQAVETLRVKGLEYQPDLVLILFCVNDFALQADGGVYQTLLRANPLSPQSTTVATYWRLLKYSRLAFIVLHRLISTEMSLTDHDKWYMENILEGQSPVRKGFELLSTLQQKHNFSALVLLLPEFSAPFTQYRSEAIHEKAFQATDGLQGFAVVDLLDFFAAVDNNAKAFSWDGLHMNEYGHEILAKILFPIVQAQSVN